METIGALRAMPYRYKVVRESRASQSAAGRYNPASVLVYWYKGKRYRAILSKGDSDEYGVYLSRGVEPSVVVVTRNAGLWYTGLETFRFADLDGRQDRKHAEYVETHESLPNSVQTSEVFFQNASEALETEKWEEWTLPYLAKVLGQWA